MKILKYTLAVIGFILLVWGWVYLLQFIPKFYDKTTSFVDLVWYIQLLDIIINLTTFAIGYFIGFFYVIYIVKLLNLEK